MRTGLSVLAILAVTTVSAAAHSAFSFEAPPVVQRDGGRERAATHLDIPSSSLFAAHNLRERDDASILLGKEHAQAIEASDGPSVTIGAFHAEVGGTGTKAHLLRYNLEGVHVLGGDVSGTIDGRQARLSISLP